MNLQKVVKISKYLSFVLRHKPENLGIELDKNGWTSVPILIEKMNLIDRDVSLEQLKQVVETNNKKRFKLNDDCSLIRANQGHSIEIDLGYDSKIPPNKLYHGTAERNLPGIFKSGLSKRDRHHVHLSTEIATAQNVGSRYGKPIVLIIDSIRMSEDGFKFYESENEVWLTNKVPVEYIIQNNELD